LPLALQFHQLTSLSTTPLDLDVVKTQKLLEDIYLSAECWGDAKKYAIILLDAMRDLAPRNYGRGILSALTDMRKICYRLKDKKVVKEMDGLVSLDDI